MISLKQYLDATSWLGLSLLLLSLTTVQPTHAANECRVKYAYSVATGTFSSTTETENVTLDAGDTHDINQSNMLYVQNLESHTVRVYRTGLGTYVDLSEDGRDPSFGNYVGNVELKKVTCLSSSSSDASGPAFQTPEAMIDAMKATGASLSEIVAAAVSAFNVSGQQMAELLKAAGYDAGQMALPLKNAFNASGQQVAQWLSQAGFWARYIAVALEDTFGASGEEVATWLRQAGFDAPKVARGLIEAFDAEANEAAAWLLEAGFTPDQIAQVFKNVFNMNPQQAAQGFHQAGFSMNDVAQALKDTFDENAAAVVEMLGALYDASYDTLRAALEFAGFTSEQIASALVGMITINTVIDDFTSGYAGTPMMDPRQNFPLHPGSNRITLSGRGLVAVTSVNSRPGGASFRIVGRGAGHEAKSDYLHVDVDVSTRTSIGTRGRATLMVGGTRGPSFNWIVQRAQSRSTTQRPPTNRAPARGGTPRPDLEPTTLDNDLYVVGAATTLDDQGNTYTALDPFNNSAFCQGIPQGAVARNNMPTANRRDIDVPDVRWGVQNTSSVDITSSFTITLTYGRREVASQQVNGLRAGESRTFTYRRPQSQTTVARVGPGDGCYHAGLSREGWNDNAGFRVEVDTGQDVNEGNENNNRRTL